MLRETGTYYITNHNVLSYTVIYCHIRVYEYLAISLLVSRLLDHGVADGHNVQGAVRRCIVAETHLSGFRASTLTTWAIQARCLTGFWGFGFRASQNGVAMFIPRSASCLVLVCVESWARSFGKMIVCHGLEAQFEAVKDLGFSA